MNLQEEPRRTGTSPLLPTFLGKVDDGNRRPPTYTEGGQATEPRETVVAHPSIGHKGQFWESEDKAH